MATKQQKQLASGLGFGVIGIYLLTLGETKGLIPLFLGMGILMWRFK